MELSANVFRREIERGGKILANAGEALHHAQAIEREPGHAHGEAKLRPQARPGVARNGDVVHFRQFRAGLIEAKLNRASGKAGGVLDAIEALFFDGGDQAAVHDDGRGGVGVIGVDSQNDHRLLDAALPSR